MQYVLTDAESITDVENDEKRIASRRCWLSSHSRYITKLSCRVCVGSHLVDQLWNKFLARIKNLNLNI